MRIKIIFLTFANSSLHRTLTRIKHQAKSINIYDEIYAFDEMNLDKNFIRKYKNKLISGSRGYGYWSWKPQIILQVLNKMKDGDILQYTDSGCHLNRGGIWRLREYIDMVGISESGVLAFQAKPPSYNGPLWTNKISKIELPDRQWIKGDLLDYFSIREDLNILNSPTIGAGIIFFKKCDASLRIVKQWANVIEQNFAFLDDSCSKSNNLPEFIEHRHDQAIFSVICKLNKVDTVSSYEYWYPKKDGLNPDWEKIKNYPIHAKRDLDYGLVRNLINLMKRIEAKVSKCLS